MKVDRYTVLHRKDERGVVVESKVFGPDDEIPEGFGESAPEGSGREFRKQAELKEWEEPLAPSEYTKVVNAPRFGGPDNDSAEASDEGDSAEKKEQPKARRQQKKDDAEPAE